MKTETTQYEFSHGKKHKGYGAWMLEVTGTDGNGSYTTETYQITDKLGDAKKAAVRRMKAEIGAVKNVVEITVMP